MLKLIIFWMSVPLSLILPLNGTWAEPFSLLNIRRVYTDGTNFLMEGTSKYSEFWYWFNGLAIKQVSTSSAMVRNGGSINLGLRDPRYDHYSKSYGNIEISPEQALIIYSDEVKVLKLIKSEDFGRVQLVIREGLTAGTIKIIEQEQELLRATYDLVDPKSGRHFLLLKRFGPPSGGWDHRILESFNGQSTEIPVSGIQGQFGISDVFLSNYDDDYYEFSLSDGRKLYFPNPNLARQTKLIRTVFGVTVSKPLVFENLQSDFLIYRTDGSQVAHDTRLNGPLDLFFEDGKFPNFSRRMQSINDICQKALH